MDTEAIPMSTSLRLVIICSPTRKMASPLVVHAKKAPLISFERANCTIRKGGESSGQKGRS